MQCFQRAFDNFIPQEKQIYTDIKKMLTEVTEAEYVITKDSKVEGFVTLQQK